MTPDYPGKRLFDWLVLAIVAVPAAAVLAACALAIRALDGAPVLFRQERVGRDGRPFRVVKLRTMAVREVRPGFPDDEPITRTGAWLRRLSLDELPQLINVARGEMSVVGPRPTLGYQVARYDDRQRRRLDVRPGLTGLAQVRGRNAITWSERIEHDLEYVERQSWRLDASIVLQSIAAVLRPSVGEHARDDPIADPGGEP